jgi:hypothetical protein
MTEIKISLFIAVPLTLISMSCQSPSATVGVPSFGATIGLESANWTTNCLSTSSGGSAKLLVSLVGGNYISTMRQYSDTLCSTPSYSGLETGTYVFTVSSAGDSGSLDWTLGTLTLTPLTSTQTSTWNSSSYCGYSDWQVDVAKSALNRTCGTTSVPAAGTISYDIYGIASAFSTFPQNSLTFGYFDTSHPGTTSANRPVSNNGSYYYHQ